MFNIIPFKHQKIAIEKVSNALAKENRIQLIMSCGTGKSLASMWSHENHIKSLNESLTILFYPSLFLVNQTYNTYKNNTILKFNPLVICSDTAIGNNENEDIFELDINEVKYPVTTNIEEIKSYLEDKNIKDKIVFVTYQSSQLIGLALNELNIKADLGIFDEAHKTATSNNDSVFSYGLKDENIPIVKRLFMTATPRHIKFNNEDNEEVEIFSMNNKELYGNIAYEYPMRAAIDDGIITDYKIMGILIDDKYIDSYTNELKPYSEEIINEAKIKAINEAMSKYKLNKALIFNKNIVSSKKLERYSNSSIFNKTIKHLDGKSKHSYRESVIQELRNSEQYVITNARLFTEGVDLPIIDMIALFRNIKSEIDIVQTVGRVQRVDKNNPNKIGYILLPIFVSNIDLIDEELTINKDLGYVYEVINSLKENDELLKNTFEYRKKNKSKPRIKNPNFEIDYLSKNEDSTVEEINERITEKIEAIIINKREPKHYTDNEWKSFFKEYDAEVGIENLISNTVYKNINLGNKIIILKAKYKKLTPKEQIAMVNFWDCLPETIFDTKKIVTKDEDWKELFIQYLKEYPIEQLTETIIWNNACLGRKLNRLRNKFKSSSLEQQKQMLTFWDCFTEDNFTKKKEQVGNNKWKELFNDFNKEFGIENLSTTTIYKNYKLGARFSSIKIKINSLSLKKQQELKAFWDCIPENMWLRNMPDFKSEEEWKDIFNEFSREFGIDTLKPSTFYKELYIHVKFTRIKSKYLKSSLEEQSQIKAYWNCFPESFWISRNEILDELNDEWKKLFICFGEEMGFENLNLRTKYQGKNLGEKLNGIKSKYNKSDANKQIELLKLWDCIPKYFFKNKLKTKEEWRELFYNFNKEIGNENLTTLTKYKNENLGFKYGDLKQQYKKSDFERKKEMREFWDCFPSSVWDNL